MGRVTELKCVLCGRSYREGEVEYTCPHCGKDGTLDVFYDYDDAAKNMSKESLRRSEERSLWRYWPILPTKNRDHIQDLAVGWTPLYRNRGIADKYRLREVYIKDDGRNPTGSLKDRASAIAITRALDLGKTVVACSSTGNAASSLAGFAAVASLESFIFVPEAAPAAKITQLLIYGSHVLLVKGDYRDAFKLSSQAIEQFGWYNRNCAINPYLVEGKKTCGIEIAEQLDWEVPDWIFISVGDGCCISGVYKAFWDLMALGMVDRLPRIVGVQASGCRPIYEAFHSESRKPMDWKKADTLADSIAVRAPANWAKAMRAARKSGGDMIFVDDDEILDAMRELAQSTGVFGEPAGVAGFAGFRKAAQRGMFAPGDRVAVIVTGNGLKDISSAQRSIGRPLTVAPDLNDLLCRMKEAGLLGFPEAGGL